MVADDRLQPKPYHVGETQELLAGGNVSRRLRLSLAVSFLLPKVYCNTILSSLNARRDLRPLVEATVDVGSRWESRVRTIIHTGCINSK